MYNIGNTNTINILTKGSPYPHKQKTICSLSLQLCLVEFFEFSYCLCYVIYIIYMLLILDFFLFA